MSIVTIRAKTLKLEAPGFVAERYTANMTRANWLRLRQTGLGGSDAASLIYPDDMAGPLTVYFDKLNPVWASSGEINWQLDFGNFQEEPMRNSIIPTFLCRAGLGPDQFRIYTSPWFYRSTGDRWHTSNIDGLIEFMVDFTYEADDGTKVFIPKGLYVLELKTAQWSKLPEWEGGAVPNRYFAQSQHYIRGVRLPGAVVFVMMGWQPSIRFLPEHVPFLDYHHHVCSTAWAGIETRVPPDAFGGTADLRSARELYDSYAQGAVEFPGLRVPAAELQAARNRKKAAEAEVKALTARFVSQIGSNGEALVDGKSEVRWRRWTNKKFDTEAFRLAYPALYERFKTREEPGSRLTVTVEGVTSDE